ncbi:TPA: metallophosphoesterase [Streptococcus suis]|nr:metallophosphoesterase [Streptococcus suis]
MGIDNYLKVIKEGVFGRDVRQAIHDSIQQAYDDATANGNANMEVAKARGTSDTLATRLTGMDSTAREIRRLMETGDAETLKRIDNVSSQIANIIATAGNGTVPSELTDIRLGSDGKVYPSAGEAVRQGLNKIEKQILEYNPTSVTANWWYHKVPNIYISPTDESKLVVEFPEGNNGFTVISKYGNKDIYLSNLFPILAGNVPNIKSAFNESTRTLELTDGKLVANLKTGAVEFRPIAVATTSEEVTLIANNYRNGSFGALIDDAFTQQKITDTVDKTVSDLAANWWYHKVPNIYISPTDENKLVVEFPEASNGFTTYSEHGRKHIYLSSVFPVLANPASGIKAAFNETTRVLELIEGKLISNLKTGNVELRPYNSTSNNEELTLIANNYRNGSFGALIDDALMRQKIVKKTSDTDEIPEYWRSHIEQKISEIQLAQANASSNSLTFLWITDTHWERNAKRSPALVKKIMTATSVPYMVHGGDFLHGGNSDAMTTLMASSLHDLTPDGRFMPIVIGNHDTNVYGDRRFTIEQLAAITSNGRATKEKFRFVDYPNSCAWSTDYTREDGIGGKVFGFAFDTHHNSNVSRNQIQAFVDLCKNDANVVVFMHWALDNKRWSGTSQAIGSLVDAINQKSAQVTISQYGTFDLTGVKAHVACLFSGHEHQDNVRMTTGGTPHIVTTCDAGSLKADNDPFEYQSGTTTEQAFDVFVIDFDRKTIKDIRIGRGENREFTFS